MARYDDVMNFYTEEFPIRHHGLDIITVNILLRHDITSLEQLADHTYVEIASLRNLGPKRLAPIIDAMQRAGIRFKSIEEATAAIAPARFQPAVPVIPVIACDPVTGRWTYPL